MTTMNGAESLVHTLRNGGVDMCFANPGTSEMHFVAAIDQVPSFRCVLALQENVATGAADGYWRMAARPSATLLHCGPGLANGLANLHNAYRAHAGIINIVGDQATYHRPLDAPLTADTAGWAAGVSSFVRVCTDAAHVGADAAEAIDNAQTGNGHIATLILPADTAWGDGGIAATVKPVSAPAHPASKTIVDIAAILRLREPTIFILGGGALREAPMAIAYSVALGHGAQLLAQTSNARIERGVGRVPIERVPYPIDKALATFAGVKHLILVGAVKPVAFFAYPDRPNQIIPGECTVHILATPEEDAAAGLEALRAALGTALIPTPAPPARPKPSRDAITPENFAISLAALLPENAVVVDESITFGRSLFPATHGARPHDWLQLTGGAIGAGLPIATGAAIAAPGRRVVSLQADGSALYTVQALWTQAREKLDITTIIFSNRKYQILLGELAAVGANPGPTALNMMDIGNPDIDWCNLARGFGVEAARAETMDAFNRLFAASVQQPGPFLIELACE